jgi:hypothetical protein
VEVPEGEAYWVKLSYLAAFSFEPGARFQSVRRWLDPVTWLIGASRSVIVHGPANLLFYGGGLKVPATSSIQTDLVVVFDASVPFQVSAYDPGPRRFTHLINAFSSKVFMTFQGGGPLLQITTGNVRKQRFIAIFRLLLSILLGVLATRAILGN